MTDEEQDNFAGMASTEEMENYAPESTYVGEAMVQEEEPQEPIAVQEPISVEVPAEGVEVDGGGRRIFLSQLSGVGQRAGELTGSALGGIGAAIGTPAKHDDGMSDLFEGLDPDDADVYCDDLVEIGEEDVFGAGGEDMSDILGVNKEDIMGEDEGKWTTKRPGRRFVLRRRTPTSGIGGMQT